MHNFGPLLCATKDPNCCWCSRPKSLWIDLRKYESTDREISLAAKRNLENHLWFVLDEAVCLSLFSYQTYCNRQGAELLQNLCKACWKKDAIIPRERSSQGEFAIQWTPTTLSCLMNDDSFLLLSADKWTENQNNKQGRENSSVESGGWRGWELFKEFNQLITKTGPIGIHYSWTGFLLTFFGQFPFLKPSEISQLNLMNCSCITCVVKFQ